MPSENMKGLRDASSGDRRFAKEEPVWYYKNQRKEYFKKLRVTVGPVL